MKTLYDVLGARPDDDAEALKKAYRSAVKANHPDHHAGDPEAAMRFKQVTAAYDILRDARLRATYDRRLEGQRRQPLPLRSKLKHTVSAMSLFIAAATVAAAVTVLLIGGYMLFVQRTGTAENMVAREQVQTAAVPAQNGAARPGPSRDALAPVIRPSVSTAAANGRGERQPATPRPAADLGRLTAEEVCKRDSARLARLRISQSRDEVLEFEQELGCEKLRPQVLRLRESVASPGPPRDAAAPLMPPQTPELAFRPGVSSAPQVPIMPDVSMAAGNGGGERQPAMPRSATDLARLALEIEEVCRRDAAQLARLRISQSRHEVLKFEQELGCEKLRPQVLRLRESVAPQ